MYRLIKFFFAITTVLIMVLLTLKPVHALSLIDQRIKVSGVWSNNKLVVYKLKYRDSRKDPLIGRINGTISDLDESQKSFKLGPYLIIWNEYTNFQQLTKADLSNWDSIKVIVQNNNIDQLTAIRIEQGTSDRSQDVLQVLGTIKTVQHRTNGDILANLLGKIIVIPSQHISPAFVLTRKQDDRRPDEQLDILLFGKPLTIGGEIGITPRYRRNFNLDPDKNRDRIRLDTEAQLELFYSWNSNLAFFLEGQVNYQQDLYRGNNGTRKSENEVKRGESWIFWGDIFNSSLSLQIGRQNFRESREWWWDDDLDAVRIFYNRPFFHFEAGIAEQFFSLSTLDNGIPAEEEKLLRILSRISWTWASKQTVGLFFLHQNDHSRQDSIGKLIRDDDLDPVDGKVTWVGLRTLNKFSTSNHGKFDFWMDGAWVHGDEHNIEFDDSGIEDISVVKNIEDNDFEGWALDVGLTWEIPFSWKPSFTIAYALGSREFRQTGLQDNNDRFGAVSRFRYYGELLRPELSNLQIWTAGATLPFLQNSSVSALYHYYRQVDAQTFLRNGRIGPAPPNGISPSIGHEWDLIVALEEWNHWELEFVTAIFKAGSAYGKKSSNIAVDMVFKVNYNF
ncbi:MAG: alginate export family protein [Methylococcaceae bacterium]|nr:alginate export family protein [Methylococcaceae bacterium]